MGQASGGKSFLLTPDGMKDMMPEELLRKMEAARQIEAVMRSYNYSRIKSPVFENIEVYDISGSFNPSGAYRLVDSDGGVLALRPDMTPPIARIAATKYQNSDLPLRLCYMENMFRQNDRYQGKQREFTQAGVELIGDSSAESTAEVIAVAVNCLLNAGVSEFKLELGSVGFLAGAIAGSKISRELQQAILDKEFTKAQSLAAGSELEELIHELPFLIGGIEVIERARGFTKSEQSLCALAELQEIAELLADFGMEDFLQFDLSMTGRLDYYTGIIFRGYARGTGFSLLDGGRYDGLLPKFGANYPAVGFAIELDNLLSVLPEASGGTKNSADTYVAFTKLGRRTAMQAADELRSAGVFIENSLLGDDYEKNAQYARAKSFGGMLYFVDSEQVIVHDLGADSKRTASINEILRGV